MTIAKKSPVPPLVSASTPGLYRDECFWTFNYPDERLREIAQAEYAQFCADGDIATLIESLPDIWEEE